jgi:hypothetical protein
MPQTDPIFVLRGNARNPLGRACFDHSHQVVFGMLIEVSRQFRIDDVNATLLELPLYDA